MQFRSACHAHLRFHLTVKELDWFSLRRRTHNRSGDGKLPRRRSNVYLDMAGNDLAVLVSALLRDQWVAHTGEISAKLAVNNID